MRLLPVLEDGCRGPRVKPANCLSDAERAKIISIATSEEFINKSPHQIVPTLADRGEFVASESSFYRVMKADEILAHRGRSQPRVVARPKALQATKPNEIYSWDITYLLSSLRGQFFISTCSSIFSLGRWSAGAYTKASAPIFRRSCYQKSAGSKGSIKTNSPCMPITAAR